MNEIKYTRCSCHILQKFKLIWNYRKPEWKPRIGQNWAKIEQIFGEDMDKIEPRLSQDRAKEEPR